MDKIIEELIEKQDLSLSVPDREPDRQYYYIKKLRGIISKMEREKGAKFKCCVTTFGCQMNARDSEKLLGILLDAGYEETEDEKEADFVLYNTCTVRENANTRVYGRLGFLNTLKKKNKNMLIALCGCMMQEPEEVERVQTTYKFVDVVFGTHNIYKMAELICNRLESDRMIVDVIKDSDKIVEELPSQRKFSFKSGVNIMFGCNNFCTYCIVPYVRGRERSREPKDIIREIEKLVADGVVEVMLLGQNVNSYGTGLDNPISFAQLLDEIQKIEGLERIRFMTPHPKDLSDELIEVMAKSEKICHHMHLPLQSGSTNILKRMNRRYTKEHYLELVSKIRSRIPDCAITTDIIVGFPGETEEDFLETMDVVEKAQYDSAYTFIYSRRSGTPAATMDNQVDDEVVKDRFNRLLELIAKCSQGNTRTLVGSTAKVLVEDVNDHDSTLVTGRLMNNTLVHFPGDESLIGKIVEVKLEEEKGFYYLGRMI